MMVTLTSKNQVTLPKKILCKFANIRYFTATEDSGRIILDPVNPISLSSVQTKLQDVGIMESDIEEAIAWARNQGAV